MMQLEVLGMIFARLAGNPVDGGKGLLAPCRRPMIRLRSVLYANAQLKAPIDPGPA
jgi:hypothetical protein